MSGSGSFAVSRSHGADRFYNPPAMRRQQQLQRQQQQQQQQSQQQQQQRQPVQRAVKAEAAVVAAEVGNRTDSDDSTNTTTLSKTSSVCSASPPRPPINVTNLDRLMESVTPFVPAQHFTEVNVRGRRAREAEPYLYYCLGDLWEAFSEWSVYGVGVPILLNGKDPIIQYYVPFLSGIQLYVDPSKPSSRIRPGEEGDAESSRETSSGGSSDCEVERRSISSSDGLRNQHGLVNLNAQRLNRLSLSDKAVMVSSSDETELSKSLGQLMFEYLEHEQPHHRRPLADKIAVLASQFPELKTCRSADLLPSSWISVAWYPIYRIPMGPTLRDLDASFLTFHTLSTQSRALSTVHPRYHGATGRKVLGNVNACSRISLPVFGLATYKLKTSILNPGGPHESEQENSLLQAADSWLRRLHVILPDYQFFRMHYSPWK
ncbi:AF4/FMR2 family member 4-like isoform X2 [Solanum pennellii]|uniref:AF4/FMR2 family member 4-like isoform X2 n=1 Tax=Solanum pennellii TaxID=28526 RepID=A0ABM1HJB6_SOLPN|nr:AF4/FMR2 family member 4-like isoform X2 [Solanum pennellii]